MVRPTDQRRGRPGGRGGWGEGGEGSGRRGEGGGRGRGRLGVGVGTLIERQHGPIACDCFLGRGMKIISLSKQANRVDKSFIV